MPATAITTRIAPLNTIVTRSARCAPSAERMAISRVR
jgi:hypothetical protein